MNAKRHACTTTNTSVGATRLATAAVLSDDCARTSPALTMYPAVYPIGSLSESSSNENSESDSPSDSPSRAFCTRWICRRDKRRDQENLGKRNRVVVRPHGCLGLLE